ncbi:DUF4180 domain-containing protein [Nonomuraea basaltis]|uniref:DUF4180 domain-containing protein n=1 Tax=Nonomuraea basaltis TaxID=2495887 RepID=UPI00110C5438|nr:DUF4180 domain-containing protein [Nonomuraea basaltis]TMR90821.1 DUF4180 domain-containing protein [Nonomuraea basaltis]
MLDDNVLVCEPDGPLLRSDRDALDLIGEAGVRGATWVAVPAERFHDDFFTLSTGVAGEIAQKFVNYRLGLAIVGDISRFTEASSALRAWVLESNRGNHIRFVRNLGELAAPRS